MRAVTLRNLKLLACIISCVLIFFLFKIFHASEDDPSEPVEKRCKIYQELRNVDFLNQKFRDTLCSGASAYLRTTDGSYPLCKLANPFENTILDIVRLRSDKAKLLDMKRPAVTMFIYKEKDAISENIRNEQSWEKDIVRVIMNFAMRVPNATFMDVGSNIGVYSVTAARLRLPVVSLDANIRNLLRLRLTLTEAGLGADLVWNFIGTNDQLSFLNFPGDCNVGGATKFGREMRDTIPVMPIRTEQLGAVISTPNVVLKLDIEGGEADFLRTSGNLFNKFKFAVVQMEWTPRHMTGSDSATIIDFFTSRHYTAWKSPGLTRLDPNASSSWKESDLLWVHEEFQHLVAIVQKEITSNK